MAGLTIDVTDTATPAIERLRAGLEVARVAPIVGRAAVNVARDHLFALNSERPNALGGDRTNFYAQAARGTSFETTSSGAELAINQVGIRQRYFGGTILPTGGRKYLTIPVRAEAYGKRASEFANLRFAIVTGMGPALVEAEATKLKQVRSKKGGVPVRRFKSAGETGGGVMFRLVRKVTQRGDPSVLPTEADFMEGIGAAVKSYAGRLIERGGGE